jgi:hypothetical protein
MNVRARNLQMQKKYLERQALLHINNLSRLVARLFGMLEPDSGESTGVLIPGGPGETQGMRHQVLRQVSEPAGEGMLVHLLLVGTDGRLRLCTIADGPRPARQWTEYSPANPLPGFGVEEVLGALTDTMERLDRTLTAQEERLAERAAELKAALERVHKSVDAARQAPTRASGPSPASRAIAAAATTITSHSAAATPIRTPTPSHSATPVNGSSIVRNVEGDQSESLVASIDDFFAPRPTPTAAANRATPPGSATAQAPVAASPAAEAAAEADAPSSEPAPTDSPHDESGEAAAARRAPRLFSRIRER